jgi:mRNA interferase RelE/StbE
MTYNLQFLPSAKKEWSKLSHEIRNQFKKKLAERLDSPSVPKDKLTGMRHCYKIKLRSSGYRLVYKILDEVVVVQVIAVGIRDRLKVYDLAKKRLKK